MLNAGGFADATTGVNVHDGGREILMFFSAVTMCARRNLVLFMISTMFSVRCLEWSPCG